MPDRIIRDELLRSHRFVALSSDTLRLVFVALVLSADDLGNAEATPTALGIALVRSVSEDVAAKWLAELADVDLVRVYESGGKRYVHMPRFRQRLRYSTGKHPRPPENIECPEIRALAQKVRPRSDLGQATDGLKTAEVRRGEEKKYIRGGRKRPVSIPMPDPFVVSDRVKAWAGAHGHDRLEAHLEYFIGYAKAHGKTYADWDQAFMNAIRDNWAKLPPAEKRRVVY